MASIDIIVPNGRQAIYVVIDSQPAQRMSVHPMPECVFSIEKWASRGGHSHPKTVTVTFAETSELG